MAVVAAALMLAWIGVCVVTGALIQSYANRRKDQVAAELTARLGRPVQIGHVDVRWLPGFGADVAGVTIGPAPGEAAPALAIARAHLRVGFLRALASLGYRVWVKEAVLTGVSAEVVRAPDGTLNWQRIAERLRSDQPSQPMSPALRDRLRGLRVDRVRVDGQVRFQDQAHGGARAAINDIHLAVDGARFDQAFQAHLEAAVLSPTRNLDLSAGFVPAPDSRGVLVAPPLQRVAVKLQPVDLAPLAPFLAGVGLDELEQGRLAADLTVDLGAAAPGGAGPTLARGTARLAAARLARGEPFDAALESDLQADLPSGNVDVRRLRISAGEMAIEAAGRLTSLAATPRFDGFTVTSRGLDFDRLRRYYPPLPRVTGLELGGPFTISARAGAEGGEQRFSLQVDLSRASIAAPGQLHKPAGTALSLAASGRAQGQTIRCDRLLFTMGQAKLEARGVLHPPAAGGRPFEASAEATPFAVRALAALSSPRRAERLPDARVGARVVARGRLGHPESLHLEVPSFSAASGSSDLAGSLALENLERPHISVDARASFLDLDDFLPPAPGKGRPSAPGKGRARRENDGVLARADGRARIEVTRGRAAGIPYQNLRADLALDQGRVRAHTLEVGAFGGRFSGAGSELPIAGQGQPFALKGTVGGMDLGALLGLLAPGSRVLAGRLDGQIDLGGRGTAPAELARSLTGNLTAGVSGAELLTAGLLGPVVHGLAQAVKVSPLARALAQGEQRIAALGDRRLGDLAAVVRFADGAMIITRPLEAHTPYGALTLGGRVPLDGSADLQGTVALAPEAVGTLVGARLDLAGPLPVEVRVTGPLRAPRIAPIHLDAPARVLAGAFARSAAAGLLPPSGQKAAEALPDAAKNAADQARDSARRASEAAGRRLRRLLPR
jgi:hypothetical protein